MSGHKTRVDLAIAFGSQVGYKLLGFVILALLARQLSRDDYGKLMFALSLCLVTVLLTDLGASQDLTRRVAAAPAAARRRLAAVLSARLPMMGLYLVGLNFWVLMTKPDVWPVAAAIAVFAMCKDLYRTFAALFFGLHRIGYTIVSFGGSLLVLAAGVGVGVALNQSLPWMVACYLCSGATLLVVSASIAFWKIGKFRIRCRLRLMKHVFGQSLLLFGLTVMSLVHFSADTFMLGYLKPYEEVARYEAAAKLLEASQFLQRPMTVILFPLCVQLAAASQWSRLRQLLGRMLLGAAALGLVATAGMALLAGWLVQVVYTAAYDDSANVLRVLYLSVPALFVATVGTFLAAAAHREKRALLVICCGVAFNVAINAYAIPRWGAMGAAWVTVGSQTVIAVWLAVEAMRIVRLHCRLDEGEAPQFQRAMEVGSG